MEDFHFRPSFWQRVKWEWWPKIINLLLGHPLEITPKNGQVCSVCNKEPKDGKLHYNIKMKRYECMPCMEATILEAVLGRLADEGIELPEKYE